ncbi:hypothetical protein GGX14DRAFT_395997 [Mycena pura]|uniref:Uncharacterized protein n=1 Tax=Mycena pura TaxID=153505 RepID=A0AAD6Y983_9AGAR|nr:hypothetical protein GGX14DRAFT_395997 [Mycena pura]
MIIASGARVGGKWRVLDRAAYGEPWEMRLHAGLASCAFYGGWRTVLLDAGADGGQHGQRVAGKGARKWAVDDAAGNTRYWGTPVNVGACREDHRLRLGGQRPAGGEQRGRALLDWACALGSERREVGGSQEGA